MNVLQTRSSRAEDRVSFGLVACIFIRIDKTGKFSQVGNVGRTIFEDIKSSRTSIDRHIDGVRNVRQIITDSPLYVMEPEISMDGLRKLTKRISMLALMWLVAGTASGCVAQTLGLGTFNSGLIFGGLRELRGQRLFQLGGRLAHAGLGRQSLSNRQSAEAGRRVLEQELEARLGTIGLVDGLSVKGRGLLKIDARWRLG